MSAMDLPRAVHRTIVVVDVEGFSNPCRTQTNHVRVRAELYRMLREAFGTSWEECWWESTGDGALVLAPPSLPKSWVIDHIPQVLENALRRHNTLHPTEEKIRLRMVLHAGEVIFDETGATSPAIILASRLLDAHALRIALRRSPGALALITSAWFFDEVVRHSPGVNPTSFRKVAIKVKETSTTGWVNLPTAVSRSTLRWRPGRSRVDQVRCVAG
jgi:class 3 adenylate cyclase